MKHIEDDQLAGVYNAPVPVPIRHGPQALDRFIDARAMRFAASMTAGGRTNLGCAPHPGPSFAFKTGMEEEKGAKRRSAGVVLLFYLALPALVAVFGRFFATVQP